MNAPQKADKPRILMVGPVAPPAGGMASVMQTLSHSPLNGDVELFVFANNSDWGRALGPLGAAIRHLVLMLSLISRTIRKRIDLIHIHTCSSFSFYRNALDVVVLQMLGRKVILHLHGGRFADFYERAGSVGRAVIRATLRRADAVIVLSERWRQWINWHVPDASVRVVANGVVVPRDPSPPAQRNPGPCRFLFLGLLAEPKGVFDLLAACRSLHSDGVAFELTLAGPWNSPAERDRFHSKVLLDRLGDCIHESGPVESSERDSLFEDADVFVLASHSEVMPVSVLEAMSHALPVIGTDVGAVSEMVADAGAIVTPGHIDELACAMRSLAADPERCRTLGVLARRRVIDHFTDNAQARALDHLYRETLDVPPLVSAFARP